MHRVGLFVAVLVGGVILIGRPPVAAGQDDRVRPRAVGMLNAEDVSASVMQAARTAITGPEGTGKNGPLAAVGMELALLYHQNRLAGAKGVRALREPAAPRPKAKVDSEVDRGQRGVPSRVHSPISADGQFVVVNAIAVENASRLLQELRQLGLEGAATAENVVSGQFPISAIKQAAALPSLRGMVTSYARTHVGAAESEADSAHAADTARLNTGTTGNGQKVCALSDSYNTASIPTSASDDVQSADLPGRENPAGRTTPVDVLEDYDGTDPSPTDEGRAMLQLIHDIAPGATLGFHTAFGGLGVFATGIQELADAGCTVVVDDVRYNIEPFYQDGPISNTIDGVVNNRGVSYFSSAGNDGQNSYEAPFRNSGEPGVINDTFIRHDFDPSGSVDTRQEITIQPDGTFQIFSFQWTDPSAIVEGSSGPDTDIDIALVNENDSLVAQSSDDNVSIGLPVESFEYTNDGSSAETLFLVIEKAPADPVPDQIKYVYSGSGFTIEEYNTGGATIYGHPMAEGAMAVAAAPFFNTAQYNPGIDSSAILEYFSSKGGLQIRFDQNGDELDTYESRQKPEVTGTDFVDNTFFGNDIDIQDPDDFPNFAGTSAAAPNIAAIAALIKQARPGLSPTAVYDRLQSSAVDVRFRQQLENGSISGELDPIGSSVDPWSGHGFVMAPEAVPPVDIAITNADAMTQQTSGSEENVELTWRLIGSGEEADVSEFVITHRYFGGDFTVRARVEASGAGEYSETIEDLPAGTHQFRIKGVGAEDTLLVQNLVSTTVRASGVNVTAYPNPFSGPVNLSVTLPEAQGDEQSVTVRVFDILGQHVATPLRDGTIGEDGSASFNLGSIRSLASGVYFFRVRGEDFVETTRAVRVR